MSKQIKEFFKLFLNDTVCYVRSEGLYVETAIERKCHLIFHEYNGLGLYCNLEFGNKDITETVHNLTENRKLFPFGELLEYMRGDFIKQLKKFEIQIGRIYFNSIENINSDFRDGVLKNCIITFKNGSVCELRCIVPYIEE